MTTQNPNYWNYVKDGLSLLVIPLLMWGIRLETTIAVQKETVARLEKLVLAFAVGSDKKDEMLTSTYYTVKNEVRIPQGKKGRY